MSDEKVVCCVSHTVQAREHTADPEQRHALPFDSDFACFAVQEIKARVFTL